MSLHVRMNLLDENDNVVFSEVEVKPVFPVRVLWHKSEIQYKELNWKKMQIIVEKNDA